VQVRATKQIRATNTKMLCWQNIPAGHSPTPPLSSLIHRFSRVSWSTIKSYHHQLSTRNHIIRSLSIVATWDHFIQEHASFSPGTISSRLVQIAWDHFIQDLNTGNRLGPFHPGLHNIIGSCTREHFIRHYTTSSIDH